MVVDESIKTFVKESKELNSGELEEFNRILEDLETQKKAVYTVQKMRYYLFE